MVGNREEFAGGEGDEGGARHAEGAAVVGVGGGEVVARVNCLLHEAAPLLAPPHRILVVEFRRRTTHFVVPILPSVGMEVGGRTVGAADGGRRRKD